MKVLLNTAYWPNLHYFYYLVNSNEAVIEQHDHYQKQSFRNRTRILSANGPLDLQVPLRKRKHKELVKEIEISQTERWQQKHWGAISSAYGNSPYFDFFAEEIGFFYNHEFKTLLEFNKAQLDCVLNILRIRKKILLSSFFEIDPPGAIDLRAIIHPKINYDQDPVVARVLTTSYYQTFGEKFNFVPNLSILDLLFNKGLETLGYLQR
jgi:hypothetical protein